MLRSLTQILLLTLLVTFGPFAAAEQDTLQTDNPMKIGTIGAGNLGGTVGELLADAGHEVMFSSRHPKELKPMANRIGPNAHTGSVSEAIEFGDVILLAVPYGAMPQISEDYAEALAGKIVLDAGNPFPSRDGPMANKALEKGAGVATKEFLPDARIVRAFNSMSYRTFEKEAHRDDPQLAVPLAGDDDQALEVAKQLVRDAGFEPVVAGGLEAGKQFDNGSDLFLKTMTADELRRALD